MAGDSAGATQVRGQHGVLSMDLCALDLKVLSIALRALAQEDLELTACIGGLVLISPWLDLSCGSHTYEARQR